MPECANHKQDGYLWSENGEYALVIRCSTCGWVFRMQFLTRAEYDAINKVGAVAITGA